MWSNPVANFMRFSDESNEPFAAAQGNASEGEKEQEGLKP